jgi:copper resistance protein B
MKAPPALIGLLLMSAPASAQDHGAHAGHDMQTDAPMPEMDHSQMDHSSMDHGNMQHGSPPKEGAQETIPRSPPPPAAFEAPQHGADAYVGAEIMAASRADVARKVSGMPLFWFQGDRLEYRARRGNDGYLWDVQGFYGGDIDKFWFKSEGEGAFNEGLESVEVQALWSHAIGPFFDLQMGVRQDLTGPERTHAVLGVQGLAPYLFEIDAAAFLSSEGDLTARVEAELDLRITQRLALQPRAEITLSAQDIPELGVGSGLDRAELGMRLRYELAREFAPYIGVEQEWLVGDSGDYARAAGENASLTNYVVGVRLWF